MKQKIETPSVLDSLKLLGDGASPITAAKAGGYKTVAGMRSAIRAYERSQPPREKGQSEQKQCSSVIPGLPTPKKEKPVTEAVRPSEQMEAKRYTGPAPRAVVPLKKSEPDDAAEAMTAMVDSNPENDDPIAPDNLPMNKDTQQEILEAGEPLRTLETSNFRVSYHKQLGSLRISVRRKAGRYTQFDARNARELYAALGFMINRYNLDKDDEFEQEE